MRGSVEEAEIDRVWHLKVAIAGIVAELDIEGFTAAVVPDRVEIGRLYQVHKDARL